MNTIKAATLQRIHNHPSIARRTAQFEGYFYYLHSINHSSALDNTHVGREWLHNPLLKILDSVPANEAEQ